MTLDAATLEALERRVAELVVDRSSPEPLVDADAVARYLGCERSWVYEHATKLRARRLGDGPKARLRFRLSEVDEALICFPNRESPTGDLPANRLKRRRARPRRLGTSVELLPVRGLGGVVKSNRERSNH